MDDLRVGLTIQEPWATAIVERWKPVENRGWGPRRVAMPCWVALHAGKEVDDDGFCFISEDCKRPEIWSKSIQPGHIIGVARLVEVVDVRTALQQLPSSHRVWACGPRCWMFDQPFRINPVDAPGQRGLWDIDGELLARVREAYARAVGSIHLSEADATTLRSLDDMPQSRLGDIARRTRAFSMDCYERLMRLRRLQMVQYHWKGATWMATSHGSGWLKQHS